MFTIYESSSTFSKTKRLSFRWMTLIPQYWLIPGTCSSVSLQSY